MYHCTGQTARDTNLKLWDNKVVIILSGDKAVF